MAENFFDREAKKHTLNFTSYTLRGSFPAELIIDVDSRKEANLIGTDHSQFYSKTNMAPYEEEAGLMVKFLTSVFCLATLKRIAEGLKTYLDNYGGSIP